MAKMARGCRTGLRPAALAVALAMVAWTAGPAGAADWKVTPSIGLTETYTDNVRLQPREQAQGQLVSELTPSLALAYAGPRLQFTGYYSKILRRNSDDTLSGTLGGQQVLRADATAKLYEDTLLLDASAAISQQANSAFGPQPLPGQGGVFAAGVTSEVKTLRIVPSLHHRFGSYARIDALYSQERALSDNAALGQYGNASASVVLASGPSFQQVGWSLSYLASRQDNKALTRSNTEPQSDAKMVAASLQYALQPGLRLLFNGGYDKYDYETLSGAEQPSGKSWSVGASWVPNGRVSVQATAGRRYYGDSYSLQATLRSRASVWALSYSDMVTTTQAQFFQRGSVSTAAFLDQLFIGTILDPVLRASVVQAYIQANNLPPSLSNATNYFSNRFMLQKQLQASAAFTGSRSTLLVSVTNSVREGLSALRVDSELLGSVGNRLNDNTRQSGVNAAISWRLSSSTAVNAGANYGRTRSLTADRTDSTKGLRANLSHQFARKLSGSLELRRTRGAGLVANSKYTENAVSATLSKQF